MAVAYHGAAITGCCGRATSIILNDLLRNDWGLVVGCTDATTSERVSNVRDLLRGIRGSQVIAKTIGARRIRTDVSCMVVTLSGSVNRRRGQVLKDLASLFIAGRLRLDG